VEEVAEGMIQVPERLLRSTLGNFIHPGKLGLFEPIQFAMQVHGCRCFARCGISGDVARS
jgi:hypothetical protein